VLDPILGDNGRKYHSVSGEQAEGLRLLCGHADLITPNLTEACLLAEIPYAQACCEELAEKLSDKVRSVLITSAKTASGVDAIVGCESGRTFEIPFERVPGHRWGTGDLFTGLLMDGLLAGKTLAQAAQEAGARVAAQLRGEEESLLPQQ